MAEPITLAVVGTLALTEGIKFLYGQAGEVLKRWRERSNAAKKAEASKDAAQPAAKEPVEVQLPEVFEGRLSSPELHYDAVERLQEPMTRLRRELSGYADDSEEINTSDENLLQNVDALRRALEAVYRQRLTFKGENRPASGPVAEGRIDVDTVEGEVTGVLARTVNSGSIRSEIKAGSVKPGGKVTGMDFDTFGQPPDKK